ncbi:tyrosine-protein phosphatase non-receptor type substrate 1 isoform X4 [Rhinichthys klamathensis goyatoka]|uniref:tyrosine-protein phosphatase non-receptor type substrate 1 isoform X4 n=1 Tax=Rhinichthys klamathensis goyatoka TaxID=3034132 RepID=UPI0024B595A1|nr:tyrosine-protein phosphatase non-receptor type substrate 1 isoform X4 [Rhinichthys klamathensis goyatoka]
MKFKVLFYLWLLGLIKPGSSADVSVSPGSSALLNCSFTLPPLVDDSLLNITWSFGGLVIASRNHTQPGFFLNTTASFIGSFPLTVYNATPDQQGVYECRVNYNETDYFTDVTLTILVPPLVSLILPEVFLKRKSVFECWARSFSPPQIMFTWTRAGNKIQEPQKLQVNRTEDGLYDAVSWLTLTPEISDQNTSFGCKVQHTALVKPILEEFTPYIIVLPMVTLSTVPSSSHSSPLTLSCDISGFYPNNLSILWIQNGKVLPELPLSIQNEDGMYMRHQYHTLSVEERSRGGEVKCVAQQHNVQEPAYGTIDLSTDDPRVQNQGLNKSAKASVAMMIISLTLVLLLCLGFSWKRRDEKLKSLNISAIVLPPRVIVGKKGRVTISVEGRLAEKVQTTWFLNDVPITDTSYKAPPEVSEIQFSEPNDEGVVTMIAQASHFHPDVITFRWFCEGGELSPVSVPPALAAPRPDAEGFFSAMSQCRLPKAELERGEARVWVTVHHMALKQPITRETRGFIKKPTISEIISPLPSAEEGPLTLACDITGFYPPEISVTWLHLKGNEMEEGEDSEGEIREGAELWGPLQTLPRTFRAKALLKALDDTARGAEIVCRVAHCSLLKPVERFWRNAHMVAPSIPRSLSVHWSRDGVGIFSVLLSGGKPVAELLWAAGGTTVSKLSSKERERKNSEGKLVLKSVCALVRTTGRQESGSRRGGHARKIRPPSVDHNAEYEKMNESVEGLKSVQEDKQPEPNEHVEENDEDEDIDPSYINTVRLRKEKRERLRVTVEISHPALSSPAYLTWTEPAEEVSS